MLKKQIIAATIFAALSASAMAEGFEEQVFDTQPGQVKAAELSKQEMKETEGAFISQQFAAATLISIPAGTYIGGSAYLLTGGKDANEFEKAAVGGAIGGAINPATTPTNGIRTAISSLVIAHTNRHMDLLNAADK